MRIIPAGFNRNKACPLCGDKPGEEEIQKCMKELKRNVQLKKGQSDDEKGETEQ